MRTMIIAIATVLLASACTSSGEETAEPLVIVPPTVPSGTAPASEETAQVEQAGPTPEPNVAPDPAVVTTTSTIEAHSPAPTNPVVTVAERTEPTATSSAPPTASLPSSSLAPESGMAPRAAPAEPVAVTPTASATGSAVDPVDLVGAASRDASTGTTTVPCAGATADVGCPPATVPQSCAAATADLGCTSAGEPTTTLSVLPRVSAGEYQRSVFVDPDAELDIYFDQARPLSEMAAICRELRGQFTARGDDGSRWAGWYYCADVDH